MHVKFPMTVSSWHMSVTFSAPLTDFTVWVGGNIHGSGTTWEFDNMDWDGNVNAGDVLDVAFLYHFSAPSEIIGITVNGVAVCGSGPGPRYSHTGLSQALPHTVCVVE